MERVAVCTHPSGYLWSKMQYWQRVDMLSFVTVALFPKHTITLTLYIDISSLVYDSMFSIFVPVGVWCHCDFSFRSIQIYSHTDLFFTSNTRRRSCICCVRRAQQWCWAPFRIWLSPGDFVVNRCLGRKTFGRVNRLDLFFSFSFSTQNNFTFWHTSLSALYWDVSSSNCAHHIILNNIIAEKFQPPKFSQLIRPMVHKSLVTLYHFNCVYSVHQNHTCLGFSVVCFCMRIYLIKQMFFMDLYSAIRFWCCFTVIIIKRLLNNI